MLKGYQMRGSFSQADLQGVNAGGGMTASSGHSNIAMSNASHGAAPYSSATAGGMTGNPVGVLIAIVVLLVALRFAAAKVGEDGDYGAIAPTFWNVLVIGLAAILGITLMKAVTLKLPNGNALRGVVQAV